MNSVGESVEKQKHRQGRQCRRPAEHFNKTRHGQTIHDRFQRERVKIIIQAVRHRADQAERRGAKENGRRQKTIGGLRDGTGLRPGQHALGFSALKGGDFLVDDVRRLQVEAFGAATENWSIDVDSHFGGYAKRSPELDAFIADFRRRHGICLDRVYVAKMLHGVFAHARSGRFPAGSTVVAVVTG